MSQLEYYISSLIEWNRHAKNTIGCDIFCDVIDNFGDAGVCWRLARDIRKEKGWNVRFYINNLETLSAIGPRVDSEKVRQHAAGIELLKWEYAERESPSDIVIETFGCRIPDPFEKNCRKKSFSIWINLEYLSAEDWVEGLSHSPFASSAVWHEKILFFPGVTNKTGELFARQDSTNTVSCLRVKRSLSKNYRSKSGESL